MTIRAVIVTILSTFSLASFASVKGHDLVSDSDIEVASGKKGTVAVFLSAKCPCSNSHIAELKELATQYPEFNFVGVHSNANETVGEASKYFSQAALGFPVISDPKAEIADRFKALKTPHAFLMSPKDEIVYRGGVTNSNIAQASTVKFLRAALENVNRGQPVKEPQGRALGCAIARAE